MTPENLMNLQSETHERIKQGQNIWWGISVAFYRKRDDGSEGGKVLNVEPDGLGYYKYKLTPVKYEIKHLWGKWRFVNSTTKERMQPVLSALFSSKKEAEDAIEWKSWRGGLLYAQFLMLYEPKKIKAD